MVGVGGSLTYQSCVRPPPKTMYLDIINGGGVRTSPPKKHFKNWMAVIRLRFFILFTYTLFFEAFKYRNTDKNEQNIPTR